MIPYNYNEKEVNRFLVEFFMQSLGDPDLKVSWYDVGEALGMDRAASSSNAEELIGSGFAEIKDLNGGICITADGVEKAKQLGAVIERTDDTILSLTDTPVLDPAACQAVARITGELKSQMGKIHMDFDSLSKMVAGLNDIDGQLSSANPETSIIRSCLRSIKGVLEKTNSTDGLILVKTLLGE